MSSPMDVRTASLSCLAIQPMLKTLLRVSGRTMVGLECVRSQIVTARFSSASQSAPGDCAVARTDGPGAPGRLPGPGSDGSGRARSASLSCAAAPDGSRSRSRPRVPDRHRDAVPRRHAQPSPRCIPQVPWRPSGQTGAERVSFGPRPSALPECDKLSLVHRGQAP